MRTDQYRTEQFADEADRAAHMRMIQREAYRYDSERDAQRSLEDDILARAATIEAYEGNDLRARHLRECAEQIKDHRESGNYTTHHRN